MIFNFGIENFKVYRGLASEEKNSANANQVNELIIDGVSEVLEGRHTEYAVDPEVEEQFMFGLLNGNYKAFKIGKSVQSITLKNGAKATKFYDKSEKDALADFFKETYLSSEASLSKPDKNRYMASNLLSYSIIVNKVIIGRVDFKFDESQKLQEILVNKI